MVNVNGEVCLNGDIRSILVNTATVWKKEVGTRMVLNYQSRQQCHHYGTWWGRYSVLVVLVHIIYIALVLN